MRNRCALSVQKSSFMNHFKSNREHGMLEVVGSIPIRSTKLSSHNPTSYIEKPANLCRALISKLCVAVQGITSSGCAKVCIPNECINRSANFPSYYRQVSNKTKFAFSNFDTYFFGSILGIGRARSYSDLTHPTDGFTSSSTFKEKSQHKTHLIGATCGKDKY